MRLESFLEIQDLEKLNLLKKGQDIPVAGRNNIFKDVKWLIVLKEIA